MPLEPEPKNPSRRAYVLKVRSDATRDVTWGLLENLVTGRPASISRRVTSCSLRLQAIFEASGGAGPG